MTIVDGPAGTVVEPVLDRRAARQAEFVNRARAELVRSGTAVTIEMIAGAVDKTPATVRQWIARQREAHRLVTVTHDRSVLVPTFQLDEAFALDADVAVLIGSLVDAGFDGWSVWHWAQTPNTWLDGRNPASVLADGDVDAAAHAVAGMLQT